MEGVDFPETAHNNIDQKVFDNNYKKIKWCKCKDKESCDMCIDEEEELDQD